MLELLADARASASSQRLKTTLNSAMDALIKKAEATRPYRVDPRCSLHVLVVGGGPIGLRAACEMSLLGHCVTLHEKRDAVMRLNVIKLWDESAQDLDSLCLKAFDANYHNGDAKRASTSRLQLALLKAALLLGVRVRLQDVDLASDGALSAYQVVIVASGAKAKGRALSNLGFKRGPACV